MTEQKKTTEAAKDDLTAEDVSNFIVHRRRAKKNPHNKRTFSISISPWLLEFVRQRQLDLSASVDAMLNSYVRHITQTEGSDYDQVRLELEGIVVQQFNERQAAKEASKIGKKRALKDKKSEG